MYNHKHKNSFGMAALTCNKKRISFSPSVNTDGLTQKQQRRKAALDIIMDDNFDKELEGLRGRSSAQLLVLINPNGDELPDGVEDGL